MSGWVDSRRYCTSVKMNFNNRLHPAPYRIRVPPAANGALCVRGPQHRAFPLRQSQKFRLFSLCSSLKDQTLGVAVNLVHTTDTSVTDAHVSRHRGPDLTSIDHKDPT